MGSLICNFSAISIQDRLQTAVHYSICLSQPETKGMPNISINVRSNVFACVCCHIPTKTKTTIKRQCP